MNRAVIRSVALSCLTMLSVGCGNKTPSSATAGSGATATSAAPTASASAAVPAGTTGLAAAGNNAEVVTAAKEALACKWSQAGLSSSCPALKKWRSSLLLKKGKADVTLLNMIEDDDPKTRWLAASTLKAHGVSFRQEKPQAVRVITAAEKEKEKTNHSNMGSVVARIDLGKTGTTDRVKKLIEQHESPALRQAVVRSVLFSNRELLFDYLMKLARESKDGQMRKAAAAAFWTGTPAGKHEASCKLWLDLAKDDDSDLAGTSAYHCAFYPHNGGCGAEWNTLLDVIEKKATSGSVTSTMTATALEYLHGQAKANAAQQKRAVAIARKLASNDKNKSIARGRAIEVVAKLAADGKKFAKKFESDKDGYVRSVAKRAQAAPSKKR